jgi:formate hydrogenlyase subunit 3/multisubunit Na+/H+ antiporter MnhD subunit
MSGNLGLTVALDMVSFYCFYALMSLASYGLVVHSRERSALRAGKIYLVMAVLGEVAVFSALALVAGAAGSLRFADVSSAIADSPWRDAILALTLVGFGIKVGAVPLHMWLPLAHPAAPVPASAVLSGAMIKAGVLGWLRLFPIGDVALPEWGGLFLLGGLLAAFFGVIVGLLQINAKTILAYSSISQMGLITIGVGLGLSAPNQSNVAITAILVYALHHALAKGALFLGVGVVGDAAAGWRRNVAFTVLTLPALALAGAPLTTGAPAKIALKQAASYAGEAWLPSLTILLSIASVGTTLLMVRFLSVTWAEKGAPSRSSSDMRPLAWSVLVFAAGGLLWVGLPTFATESLQPLLSWKKTWPLLWPVATGLGLGIAGHLLLARKGLWLRGARRPRNLITVPPGDLIVWIERVLRDLRDRARRSGQRLAGRAARGPAPGTILRWGFHKMGRLLLRGETSLQQWPAASVMLLILAAAIGITLLG